jgi:FG-GAP-like repeat/Bacterial Ig-like domain
MARRIAVPCPALAAAAALVVLALSTAAPARAVDLQVVGTTPAPNGMAPATTAITIDFDRAVKTSSVDHASFRVFGRGTGTKTGAFTFTNGNQSVTLTPTTPFSAGEIVTVNLSHDLLAADNAPLRSAGYAFQFTVAAQPGPRVFQYLNLMSNRPSPGFQTRIYGAQATDLNGDGFLDLATVNEVSADVRVTLNLADGTGFYGPFLSPKAIGLESSPNEQADFDNDGKTDGCFSAADGQGVWILRGNGNGTYGSTQTVDLGGEPHGIAALDVDGDGDWDIVDANVASGDLALMLNDGSGGFGSPTTFDGGVGGEYALAAGDMNGDGIMDLVVGGRNSEEIRTLLGNGDGTFTQAAVQSSGGLTWVVALGDVDGDGILDATAANSVSNNGAVLIGNGDGTFAAPVTVSSGAHTPSTDLGDLDGDGDLDWVLSVYGGGEWLLYANDGSGHFTFDQSFPALNNPSCAVLLDFDNDGDIDMALTDEIADVVVLEENVGVNAATPTPACAPTPEPCRTPAVGGKAFFQLQDKSPDDKDRLTWKWLKGATTPKADFGNPVTTDGYDLCVYDAGALVASAIAPAGGTCAGKPCWKDKTKGFDYKDKDLTPGGLQKMVMREGLLDGKAKIILKGKGANLPMPDLGTLTGPLDVQLRRRTGGMCFGATYSAPFLKNDGVTLKDKAD